jgi:integrase
MRINKYGVRGLKGVQLPNAFVYFWVPTLSLQKAGIFRYSTLGSDFECAVTKARALNEKLDMYRGGLKTPKMKLTNVAPTTFGYLIREFEASPRFAHYAPRTQEDYSNICRNVETQAIDGQRMFGELTVADVTKQLAYTIYEQNILAHGLAQANKISSVCQRAFRYGVLRRAEITTNPFSDLDRMTPPSRRQRWSENQLCNFTAKAEEMSLSSIGLCALLCMELVQRPGDILSMKWSAYQQRERTWHIGQSKRGAEVRVPETKRLRKALGVARRVAREKAGGNIDEALVCQTVTGKRWHRRNFTKAVRRIARAAGLPDDLQIRDLRRTAATEGASAGATPAELMAVGGWTNPASIRPYLVQTIEQAAHFQAKRDAYRKKD